MKEQDWMDTQKETWYFSTFFPRNPRPGSPFKMFVHLKAESAESVAPLLPAASDATQESRRCWFVFSWLMANILDMGKSWKIIIDFKHKCYTILWSLLVVHLCLHHRVYSVGMSFLFSEPKLSAKLQNSFALNLTSYTSWCTVYPQNHLKRREKTATGQRTRWQENILSYINRCNLCKLRNAITIALCNVWGNLPVWIRRVGVRHLITTSIAWSQSAIPSTMPACPELQYDNSSLNMSEMTLREQQHGQVMKATLLRKSLGSGRNTQ